MRQNKRLPPDASVEHGDALPELPRAAVPRPFSQRLPERQPETGHHNKKKEEEELNKCNSLVLSSRIKQPEGKQSHVLSSHLCYSAAVCQHWRAIFPRRLLSFPKLTAREQRRVLAITCRHGYRMPPQV